MARDIRSVVVAVTGLAVPGIWMAEDPFVHRVSGWASKLGSCSTMRRRSVNRTANGSSRVHLQFLRDAVNVEPAEEREGHCVPVGECPG